MFVKIIYYLLNNKIVFIKVRNMSPRSSGFLKLYAKDMLCNEMFVLKKKTYKSIYYYSIIIKMY